MKEINGQKFYETKDLALLLGVTEATIANKRRKGEILSIRLGRKLYTSETNLQKFLNGETAPSSKSRSGQSETDLREGK